MKQKRKHLPGRIPLTMYLLALVGWLLVCTLSLVEDNRARAAGMMPEITFQSKEFGLVDILQAGDDKLACITADPQLWWNNYLGIRIRTVRMTASYSQNPLEICLFYCTEGEDNFTHSQRVYAQDNGDGSYTFTLPTSRVTALRLDPCSTTCVMRDFTLTMNPARSAWYYYLPTYWQLFEMILYPGLAASLASILHGSLAPLWAARRRRAAAPPPDKAQG